MLREHNPRCLAAVENGEKGMNFFDGLEGRNLRFVPFNGGLGTAQLDWLRSTVREAVARGDRIIVFGHLAMLKEASSERTMLYDAEDALRILHDDGRGHCVAVVAGHLHRGGYALDERGIHHVTLRSPLNYRDSFGYADVYADRVEIVGSGELLSHSLPLPVIY